MKDFKSPKKQRKADTLTLHSEAAAEVADNSLETAGSLVAPATARLETVTEAARAFRQLRVRPQGAVSGADHSRAGSPLGQPRSPKKRKATGRLDKEFILKDDKVKRSTDQQGDISQARGMLGQLLFEFGQLELNRDLLEAIKRTESRTGRQSRSKNQQHELDRIAFEYVVSEAAELLTSQMATVAAHSDDLAVQRAVLRAYAVQAIATFADEDDPSEGEEADGEGGSGYSSDADGDIRSRSLGGSPREAGQPTREHQQQQAAAHSSDMEPVSVASHEKGPGHSGLGLSEEFGGSPACEPSRSVDMLAPAASLAPAALPSGYVEQGTEVQERQKELQQQVGEAQAQGSAPETVSSSVLPDAPTEAALEDTATQQPRQHVLPSAAVQQQSALVATHTGQQQEQPSLAGPFAPAAQLPTAASLLQGEHAVVGRSAEGPVQAQSSGLDDVMQQLSDAVDEMLRSPEAVTSRPRSPWLPHGPPLAAAAAQDKGGRSPSLLAVQQLFGGPEAGAAAPQDTPAAPGGVAELLSAKAGEEQQQQEQQLQHLHDLHLPVAAAGPQADRPPHHPPHPGVRLHHTTHRPVRAQRRHTLPALKEENSVRDGRGEAATLSGAASARLPLRALSPQETHQREQHSSGGSGGTSHSDAQNEALKRQRTDAADGAATTLHVQQQHPQQDASPAWRAGPAIEDQVPLAAQRMPPQEATSPLFDPQLPAGLIPSPQSQPQQLLHPQSAPEAAAGLLGALPPSPPQHPGLLLVPLQGATDGAGGAVLEHLGVQQQQGVAAGEEDEGSVEARGVARSGGSAWGSTLVCADLTLNDVASKYWPFLRSAMQGQGTTLRDDDTALVASLVRTLGETISMAFALESGGRLPSPETKSLLAATAFDDMFRDKFAQGTSTASK